MTRRGAWICIGAAAAAGLVAGLALAASTAARAYDAASSCVVVSLHYVVDGAPLTPQVAGGHPPGLICQGTAYVPLRFLAEAVGQTVTWNAATRTVTLSAPAAPPQAQPPALPTPQGTASSSGTTPSGGAPATPPSGTAAAHTVKSGTLSGLVGLGPVLVDGQGMTLYTYTADSFGTSHCTGVCADTFRPLLSGHPTAAPGIRGVLATTVRAGGRRQVTYNGQPLYTYTGDRQPGQANGQGLLGQWYVVPVSRR